MDNTTFDQVIVAEEKQEKQEEVPAKPVELVKNDQAVFNVNISSAFD